MNRPNQTIQQPKKLKKKNIFKATKMFSLPKLVHK